MSIYGGKILKVIKRPCYDMVTELIPKNEYGTSKDMEITYALSKQGHYIGDTKTAWRLVNKKGISVFELRKETSNTVSIGYNLHEKKWYGWSHRAIFGFKRKRDAERFAESVS
jgi:hypothetical protein